MDAARVRKEWWNSESSFPLAMFRSFSRMRQVMGNWIRAAAGRLVRRGWRAGGEGLTAEDNQEGTGGRRRFQAGRYEDGGWRGRSGVSISRAVVWCGNGTARGWRRADGAGAARWRRVSDRTVEVLIQSRPGVGTSSRYRAYPAKRITAMPGPRALDLTRRLINGIDAFPPLRI